MNPFSVTCSGPSLGNQSVNNAGNALFTQRSYFGVQSSPALAPRPNTPAPSCVPDQNLQTSLDDMITKLLDEGEEFKSTVNESNKGQLDQYCQWLSEASSEENGRVTSSLYQDILQMSKHH